MTEGLKSDSADFTDSADRSYWRTIDVRLSGSILFCGFNKKHLEAWIRPTIDTRERTIRRIRKIRRIALMTFGH
jgi:hypothetical protein